MEVPLNVVVQTAQAKQSGNQGGVPMFSRSGRQTIAEKQEFQNLEEHAKKTGKSPIGQICEGHNESEDVLE